MFRSAIIILCVSYCAFLVGQTVTISRDFETRKKNVPIVTINNYGHYFHVLRYNKDIHDFTVERRSKPSAEIIAFTPLKLDSVNADWFDYENLDYLFFESNHKVYFLFEKILNNKREIYLKTIDSAGKASGFNQLAVLNQDKTIQDIKFEFKITAQNKILIVATQEYFVGTTKKVALLYDPEKQEKVWVKKLPQENRETAFSYGYECNEQGDLYYVMLHSQVVGFKRKYISQAQIQVPVFSYEIKNIAHSRKNSSEISTTEVAAKNIAQLYGLSICPLNKAVTLVLHFSQENQAGEENVFFSTQKWNEDLTKVEYANIQALDDRINKQLTFYDGGDYKNAADKDYTIVKEVLRDSCYFILSERKDVNYYKELLLIKVNLKNGEILNQEIIPRKIFYYKNRTRFKNAGECIQVMRNGNYSVYLLENERNLTKAPRDFRFAKYKRAGGAGSANMVCYTLTSSGDLEKEVVTFENWRNIVPLRGNTRDGELLLYLNADDYERFAILRLKNP